MGTRPGLRSIPHISGILLLMQLLLLQPLVDAKAETSAAVDARFEASPAKVTDFKQENDAHGFRVFITFEGNPHYRGKEKMMRKKEKKKMKRKKKKMKKKKKKR